MHRVGAAHGGRGGLGEAEVPHLALLDQPGHGADGVLDGHARIHPVLVVEVDAVDAQPLEARLAGLRHVLGPAVDPGGAVRLPQVAELGGQHHPVALAPEGPAQQLLVLPPAVHVGGVQEVDAQVEGAVDDRDGLRVVALAVDVGHGHAPESDGRDGQCALAECTLLHEILLRVGKVG